MESRVIARIQPRADERSRIVEAATAACRQYGPSKTNVADIARLLGKSPANVYKGFPSKAAILDAVAASFFETRFCFTLSAESGQASATERLKETVLGQHRLMLQARDNDAQMFSLMALAAEDNWPSFKRYLKRLEAAVGELILAGIAAEEFAQAKIEVAASCFCASISVLWDPRIIEALPSSRCDMSAHELVSFAVSGLR
ncbi:AcrR family transcriptional regulator [Rhizobium mesoamericanum]|uniref:TetR/AcrR family transcriptional regulator n=1 Tax=Rhizobium mesoamericanum TaxID=1079800 RepID=UPI00278A4122|nr:TetR family transcriptional regulator [Rhizobium mesoamericanum]MDQ0564306.1 AcrR family transcriptional regulator [Rhizobium mesoamericanum]